MSTIQVDFQKRSRPRLVHVESGVYQYQGAALDNGRSNAPRWSNAARWYERPMIGGKQSVRKLASTTLGKAKQEVARKRTEQARAKIGLALDPYAQVEAKQTISQLAVFYQECGCPQRSEAKREGKQLIEEKKRVAHLIDFFGARPWDKITLEDCRSFHGYRLKQITGGKGHRTVDMELVALSAIYRWAVRSGRRTGVTSNPVAHDRMTFCLPETVRHCRELQPASGDELHNLARFLFSSERSEVLGWQLLFEAMIGHRTHEILKLRKDASASYQPGFVESSHLWLYNSKTKKGTFPYIKIHAALRDCLAGFDKWHQERFTGKKESSWYFPSPEDPKKCVGPAALTHALRRICPALGIPHRTSHGLRSFYVNVLRSGGLSDAEIALRIGHRSGGRLIIDVYGEILPTKLHWLPKEGEPAWSIFDPKSEQRPVQLDLGI
jgi:integrase